MAETEVATMRDAIIEWARADDAGRPHGPGRVAYDRAHLAEVLAGHGITLTSEQIDVAHGLLRQRAFMGGNFTLDAKAVLRALTPTLPPSSGVRATASERHEA